MAGEAVRIASGFILLQPEVAAGRPSIDFKQQSNVVVEECLRVSVQHR